jgi:ankyrin repeat protein
MDLLLKTHADLIDFRFGGEPLLVLAARRGTEKCLEFLLNIRADVNGSCSNRRTAMWHAASKGNLVLIKKLYSLGAEIDEPDVNGVTPFATACTGGFVEVVEYLYRLSPSLITTDVTLSSGESWPPLFLSLFHRQRGVSEFIISKSGPIALTARDYGGFTAIFETMRAGLHDVGQSLIRRILKSKVPGSREMALQLICAPMGSKVPTEVPCGSPVW